MSSPTLSIVMVPVPEDRLLDVYRVLGSTPDGPISATTPPGSAWSPHDIARLDRELGPTKAVRVILDLGSAHPGQKVWFGDVCEQVDRSHPSVRAELGGFTKWLKSHFGRSDWPFRADWVDGRALYTVDEEVARVWLGQDNRS